MNKKDTLLLEQQYELVRIKSFLLSGGFSEEDIQTAIDEGKIMDLLKSAGTGLKKLGIAAVISAAMFGSNAQAASTDSHSEFQAKHDQIEQSTNAVKVDLKVQRTLIDMASRCSTAWQKQDVEGLKKIREELKTLCKITDNKELDKVLSETDTSGSFMGLHLLKTQSIGD